MGILFSVSTFVFVVLCILLIIIILLQSDKSAGMGVLGGSSQSAFGSSTADVITKITAGLVTFFLLGALGLAVLEATVSSSLDKKVMGSGVVDEGVIRKSSDTMKKSENNGNSPEEKKPAAK
jgi:preprotein translocase subunit SecG